MSKEGFISQSAAITPLEQPSARSWADEFPGFFRETGRLLLKGGHGLPRNEEKHYIFGFLLAKQLLKILSNTILEYFWNLFVFLSPSLLSILI